MQSLAKLMEDAVGEQGGVVQGFTGDGVMAVFGAPVALEDAPLRACRAALAIHERLKAAGGDLEAKHGVRPQLRIGINTGLAVVGTGSRRRERRRYGSRRHRECRGAPASHGRAGNGGHERGNATAGARIGRGEFRWRSSIQGQGRASEGLSARLHPPGGDAVRGGGGAGPQRLCRARARAGNSWSAASPRRAASFTSSTSWPSRAWASRACCMSSASASARSKPSSCREAARPTASRRRSCPSSRWCAARFRSAPAKPRPKSRASSRWG